MSLTETQWNASIVADRLQEAMRALESARDQLGGIAALRARIGPHFAEKMLLLAESVDGVLNRAACLADDLGATPEPKP